MLNYETLLSSYDDKLTLMQWLKNVEDALKNASAVGFSVNKKGSATISFQIDFEDGTSLESGDIVLQQGESVASAYISSGHLHLVLTNGDDLDAGDLFNGNITINGNVAVNGALSTTGTISGGGNVEADGNIEADGDIEAVGALKGASATISGNVSAGGNLSVTGNYSSASGSVNVGGSVSAGGGVSTPTASVTYSLSTPRITSSGEEIEAQKPIVEVMAGYSLNYTSEQFTPDYVGISKNGNKLSIAFNGVVTTQSTHPDGGYVLVRFNMPNSIGNKIIPHFEGLLSNLLISVLEGNNQWAAPTTGFVRCVKYSSYQLQFYLLTSGLNVSSSYYIRVETTFLLSENLAA